MKLLLPITMLFAGGTYAQIPVITSVIPRANARAVDRSTPLTITFSQPLTAASVDALKVYSSQQGGLRTQAATPAMVSGNTLSFTPTGSRFLPGETVQYTVTMAASSSSGPLARARVGQFTTAVGRTGTGQFLPGATVSVGQTPWSVAVGDIDGDGDLDLLSTSSRTTGVPGTVSIRLNDGRGLFTGSQEVNVELDPQSVAVGDFDGDGDLDFVTSNYNSSTLSVRYNDGTGTFPSGQTVYLPVDPSMIKVGDIDGDGDLDFVVARLNGSTVGVVLNDGASFRVGPSVSVGSSPLSLVLGDVDSDGDVDLLVAHAAASSSASKVSVCLNNGSGTFGVSQSLPISTDPWDIATGDIDGDGDLDLLLANFTSSNTVSVRRNNGTGTFSGNQEVTIGTAPFRVMLSDVDGDSDLDLLAASYSSNMLSLQLNDGSGNYTALPNITLANAQNVNVAVGACFGDVDLDGDLDLLASATDNTVRVLLNNGTALSTAAGQYHAAGLMVYPNPVHSTVNLIGAKPHAPVTLVDAVGRVLLTANADGQGQAQFRLPANLAAGLYLVRSGGFTRRMLVN